MQSELNTFSEMGTVLLSTMEQVLLLIAIIRVERESLLKVNCFTDHIEN